MTKHRSFFILLSILLFINCEIIQVNQDDNAASRSSQVDLNCKKKNNDGSCEECYQGFYYDRFQELKCVVVSGLCDTYDRDGLCLTCYEGYSEISGECVIIQNIFENSRDKNCALFSQKNPDLCIRCSFKYYFNRNNVCTQINPQCQSWNNYGKCQSCYPGYDLVNSQCIVADGSYIPVADIDYCKDPELNENDELVCFECIFRAVLIDNECFKVSDLCQNWGDDGFCTSCYGGYQQVNGSCLIEDNLNQNTVQETYCSKTDDNGRCEECIFRYYLRPNGYCAQISNLCKEWNNQTGKCTDCYKGYDFEDGVCFVPDENCEIMSVYGCVKCVDRHFLGPDGKCTLVNAICNEFNPFNGKCINCIDGYEYKGQGVCKKIQE